MVMVNVLYLSFFYIYLELTLNGAAVHVLQYIVVNTSFFFFTYM